MKHASLCSSTDQGALGQAQRRSMLTSTSARCSTSCVPLRRSATRARHTARQARPAASFMRFFDFDARKPASALASNRHALADCVRLCAREREHVGHEGLEGAALCRPLAQPKASISSVGASCGSGARSCASLHRDESGAAKEVCAWRRVRRDGWYTKLAVDRLLLNKLQTLLDPQYRQSFRRAEDRAKKQGGGYWWGPGENRPFP